VNEYNQIIFLFNICGGDLVTKCSKYGTISTLDETNYTLGKFYCYSDPSKELFMIKNLDVFNNYTNDLSKDLSDGLSKIYTNENTFVVLKHINSSDLDGSEIVT
jgi:hypothetical protein